MTTKTEALGVTKRLHWLDNLRTVMILLVVLYHVGGVYESAGLWGWFWIVDDPATITWVGIVGIIFDITLMPVVFFVSGYLAPASLQSKTSGQFVVSKLKRLMLPWVIAVATLIPLYKVIFLASRGLPQEHWTSYSHLTNPNSQNWLWFLPLLFAFSLVYLALCRVGVKFGKVSLKGTVIAGTGLAILYSMLAGSVAGFRSWTLTPVLDFENERLLSHLFCYLIGAICYERRVFAGKPSGKLLYTIASSVAWLPVTVHIFARLFPFFYPESYAVTPLYRLIWWSSFHTGTLCMAYLMVESFRRYVNKTGPAWGTLNRSAYGVYIIHVIMIGVFGTLLLGVDLHPVIKYVALFALTYGTSNLVTAGWRAVARLRRSRREAMAGPERTVTPTAG